MQGFLEVVGTENAERQLSAFLCEVRSAVPATSPQTSHRALITAAVATLERRLASAREVLENQNAEAAAEAQWAEKHILDLEESVAMFAQTRDPAVPEDLVERLGILQGMMPTLARQSKLLGRARQWINDLGAAAEELRRRDAETEFGVNSPGLLRALTVVSAALDTMTAGVRNERIARHASITDLGFARLVQLGGTAQSPMAQAKKAKLSNAGARLERIRERMTTLGGVGQAREQKTRAGSVDHGGA